MPPQVPVEAFSSLSVVSIDNRKLSWVKDLGGHPSDVLFGHYKYAKDHPGNKNCGTWISNSFLDTGYAFDSSERWQKEIVPRVKSCGGKFLVPEDPTKPPPEAIWLPISNEEARKLLLSYKIEQTQIPTKDILCGQSRMLNENYGNAWFRTICEQNYDAYNDTPRKEKTKLSKLIVEFAHEQERRFLKEVFLKSKLWMEMNKIKAREKVTSEFRSIREKRKKSIDQFIESIESIEQTDQEILSELFRDEEGERVEESDDRKRKANEKDSSVIEQKRLRMLNSKSCKIATVSNEEDWEKIVQNLLKSKVGEWSNEKGDPKDFIVGKELTRAFDQDEEMQSNEDDENNDDDDDDDDNSLNDGDSEEKDELKKDRDTDGNDGGNCGNAGRGNDDGDDRSNNRHSEEDDSQRKNSEEDGGNNKANREDNHGSVNEEMNDSNYNYNYGHESDNESGSDIDDESDDDSEDDSDNDGDDGSDDTSEDGSKVDYMCADLRMKQLIVAKFDSYRTSDADQKHEITKGVLETLRNEGWLFLRQPSIQKQGAKRKASWLYVGNFEAQVTVARTFHALERLEQLKNFNTSTKANRATDHLLASLPGDPPVVDKEIVSDRMLDSSVNASVNSAKLSELQKIKRWNSAKLSEVRKIKRWKQQQIRDKHWPRRWIEVPHENDIIYGHGGREAIHHPGNKRYQKIVEDHKVKYKDSRRLQKPLVVLDIIRQWRAQSPPGRFLKYDDKTGLFNDMGDRKARKKTIQALREKAPPIRTNFEDLPYRKRITKVKEPEPILNEGKCVDDMIEAGASFNFNKIEKTNKDVLMGQSPKLQNHSGNVQLRELVVTYYDKYFASFKPKKIKIIEEVIDTVERSGGRFLKSVNGQWVVVTDRIEIRDKIASTFRGEKKKRCNKSSKTSRSNKGNYSSESGTEGRARYPHTLTTWQSPKGPL